MKLDRREWFAIFLSASFLAPIAIPNMGIDYPYFFIMVLVLTAWFSIKWSSIKNLPSNTRLVWFLIGGAMIAADYFYNFVTVSRLGLIDMLILLSGLVVAFYGISSFKTFWVPVMYGVVLLAGYQIENFLPNFVALQNWMATTMTTSMQVLGISASVSGHMVTLNTTSGPLLLNVESDCTGVQGILAFGLLSTMAVLDIKAKVSRLVPLFIIGFVGAFLINIVRLIGVFLTFEFLGIAAGTQVHVYLGYVLFIIWVMAFWSLAFRYLLPAKTSSLKASAGVPLHGAKSL